VKDRVIGIVHWANTGFTLGAITLDLDTLLKIAAFLTVTVPLAAIQWWNLIDRYRERQAKKNVG
jgi:hypothetical protein